MADDGTISRRGLVTAGGATLASATLAGAALGAGAARAASPVDTGRVEGGRVTFPNWRGPADRPAPEPAAPLPPAERVGFALVGVGRLTLERLLPAFAQTRLARPVALVSGTPDKARLVARQYGIPERAVHDYAGFERLADDPAVQAVYVVLPNGLHREFVLRAAAIRRHVLCEKPMANSSAEAREMVRACAEAGVKLMIAYRCQYERHNREVARLVRSGEVGAARLIEAVNVQSAGEGDQWRYRAALAGGGALPDIGLYCLNTARAILGEEPVGVQAQMMSPPDDPRYREVEETMAFLLRFPSGALATATTSYGAHEHRALKVQTERAAIDLQNAFAYEGQRLLIARRGERGAEAVEERVLPQRDQFALEIDHMAACIREDRRPRTPGEEGVQDHVVMEAIYEAARTGALIRLPEVPGRDTTRGPEPSDG